jgi:hypothetical protein
MTDSDTGRDADDASKNGNGAKTILAQARKDWDAAELRERQNIRLAYEDLEFLAGDELSQWPEKQRRKRENDGRPTLQINQLPQFVHQITGDIRQLPLRRFRDLLPRRRQPGRLWHWLLARRDRIRSATATWWRPWADHAAREAGCPSMLCAVTWNYGGGQKNPRHSIDRGDRRAAVAGFTKVEP